MVFLLTTDPPAAPSRPRAWAGGLVPQASASAPRLSDCEFGWWQLSSWRPPFRSDSPRSGLWPAPTTRTAVRALLVTGRARSTWGGLGEAS